MHALPTLRLSQVLIAAISLTQIDALIDQSSKSGEYVYIATSHAQVRSFEHWSISA